MKRWLLPAICALVIHAAFFTIKAPWRPPTISLPSSSAIAISLSAPPPAPPARPHVQPLKPAIPAAIAPLRPKKPAVPKPVPKPAPKIAPAPLPAEKPDVKPQELKPPDVQQPDRDQEDTAPPPQRAVDHGPADSGAAATAAASAPSSEPSDPQQAQGPEQAQVQASVPLYDLNPAPDYPAAARRRNYQGTVLIDVLVDQGGRAAQVKIGQSSGYAMLDRSALESVRRWRFEPARRSGRAIEMWVQVPVRFALQ